jgi:hypothetical protein
MHHGLYRSLNNRHLDVQKRTLAGVFALEMRRLRVLWDFRAFASSAAIFWQVVYCPLLRGVALKDARTYASRWYIAHLPIERHAAHFGRISANCQVF